MSEQEPPYTVGPPPEDYWLAQGVTMKRAMRLMDIIECLQERPRTTHELARRYEVSLRTIRRDLLDIQGHPKYAALVRRIRWGFMDSS